MRLPRLSVLCLMSSLAWAAPADAADPDPGEVLFNRGLAAMQAGLYEDGCPDIQKSYQIDPRPGTLFTLAECEAQRGRFATAVTRYDEYLTLFATLPPGKQAQQLDREKISREQKAVLEPKLSRLTITVPKAPIGLEVLRDGTALNMSVGGIAVPVDPGKHVVEARAPGKKPWSTTVEISATGARAQVTVPALEDTTNAPMLEDTAKATAASETPVNSDMQAKTKRNIVGLWLQFDAALIGGKDDVCTQVAGQAGNYTCFVSGTNQQFDGAIEKVNGTNGILVGGFKFIADLRLLGAYDRQLVASLPITVGARLGWAFGGSPTPDNEKAINDDKRVQLARAFFGFHYEVRGAYHFGGSLLEDKKFRPYAFLAFGGGQVNASAPVTVCDTTAFAAGTAGKPCKVGSGKNIATTVDAYQITGLNFIGFGGGTTFGITPQFGVAAELKFMLMVPAFGFVLAPSIGPVLAF